MTTRTSYLPTVSEDFSHQNNSAAQHRMTTPSDNNSSARKKRKARAPPAGYSWASDLVSSNVQSPARTGRFHIKEKEWRWLEGPQGQGLDYSNPQDRVIYDKNMGPSLMIDEEKQKVEKQEGKSTSASTLTHDGRPPDNNNNHTAATPKIDGCPPDNNDNLSAATSVTDGQHEISSFVVEKSPK